jgi:hypothetical protein
MMADYVFWAAIAVMIAASIFFAPRIARDRIVMQWALDGRPVWHGPRWLGLWGLIGFALALRLMIWAAMTWAPDRVHGTDLGLMIMAVTVTISHLLVLARAAYAT